jgi:hypothetical protein
MCHDSAADSKKSAGAPEHEFEITADMLNAVDGIGVSGDDAYPERVRAYSSIFASMLVRSRHPSVANVKRVVSDGCVWDQRVV